MRVQSVILIGLCSLVFGFMVVISQDQIKLADLVPGASVALPVSHAPVIEIRAASLAELLQRRSLPDTMILDARLARFFTYGSIEKSVSLPVRAEPDPAQRAQIDAAEKVIIYDAGGPDRSAMVLARKLADDGVKHVAVYPGGWTEWKQCGLPMTMSDGLRRELHPSAPTAALSSQ